MKLIHAEYTPMNNSIDINHYNGYILRIDCNGGIAEHGFRPCGGKLQKSGGADRTVFLDQRIFDMPEMSGLFFVFNLSIAQRGLAMRAPVL